MLQTTILAVTKRPRRETTISRRKKGFIRSYRSGLEEQLAQQIEAAGIEVKYETEKISYTWPARDAKYTPDWKLPKQGGYFFVESKGVFDVNDRQKHLLIKEQHPDIDLRFVFSNCNQRIYKGSPTTYAMWCEKHGFAYANKRIPDDWLSEGSNDNDAE